MSIKLKSQSKSYKKKENGKNDIIKTVTMSTMVKIKKKENTKDEM